MNNNEDMNDKNRSNESSPPKENNNSQKKRNNHKNGSKNNNGYGRRGKYAIREALKDNYLPDGQYSTTRTYHSRGDKYENFLVSIGIRDLMKVTLKHHESYANFLRNERDQGLLSQKSCHNDLSAANCVLASVRGDRKKIYLSPLDQFGPRMYVREKPPMHTEREVIAMLVRYLFERGHDRVALLVLICRYGGTRPNEGLLLDPVKALKQLAKQGYLVLTKGTKGNRDRDFQADPKIDPILRRIVKITGGRNLVPANKTYKQFYNWCIYRLRKAVKELGLDGLNFREMRAAYLTEVYESVAKDDAPYKNGGRVVSRQADRAARIEVAKHAGHGRESCAGPYVGTTVKAKGKKNERD